MAEEDNKNELDVTLPGGIGARMRGFRIMDIICLCSAFGIGYVAMQSYSHAGETKEDRAAVAKSLSESQQAVANTLKETNAAVIRALENLTAEQKRSTNAAKEIACLSDPAMRNRNDAREFCKRMSRDDR